ncbi:hypothetical protein [Bombilactobacillus thymidiniphilus]|uniref:Uncharacterized protein n=1 Tax=Bombilactobacillus thymidiniphilus TaxID=2923363 RepID=A0ABY4PEF3_9LACO|nr:hypothetical protein [Bombilactobacillus thymidiniphilus]UQS84169.1 hypothetical protein MOO47_03190 [Bombilactobacillus thymidiniphilus]
MSLIIGGFIAIVILLNIKNNPQIDISVYEKSFLESTNFKKMSMAITICLFLVIYILLFISMSLGVASGNLLVLLFLGCATSYYIILLRFIYFMLDRKVTGSRQMSGSFFGRCIRRYMKLGPLASMEPGDTYMLFKRVKE